MRTSQERFASACRCEAVDRPPVWLMRQAGRYLPEYRAVRAKHDFWEMVRTPELAAAVTEQPVRRFDMDAAILFSDILIVPDAMGIEVRYEPGGPVLSPLVASLADVLALCEVEPARDFAYVAEAIRLLTARLHPEKALIGFAGAPFTLAAYMVQGGPARSVDRLKALAHRDRGAYDLLLDRVTAAVTGLLALQIEAGVDAVQIFDTWAWHLGPDDYVDLALPYTARIIERLRPHGRPVISYLRSAAAHLEAAAAAGPDVLSIDCTIRLADAMARAPAGVALQGNFDPALLFAPPAVIAGAVERQLALVRERGAGRGYIVNLGQGLTPEIPIEGVEALVNAVRGAG